MFPTPTQTRLQPKIIAAICAIAGALPPEEGGAGTEKASMSTTTLSAASSSKDSNLCPICLEPIKQEAYLERCLHTFCHGCIRNWTKYISRQHSQSLTSIKCPLCKSENSSIIYDLSGKFFRRHFVNKDPESSFLTSAHKFRWQSYEIEPAGMICHKFNVLSYWKNRRYLQQNRFLQTWLRREIQTLLQDEDVDIIVHHILGVIKSFLKRQQECLKLPPEEKQKEFKQLLSHAARPFISERTDRFVDELELFLASSLNIEAYDRICMEYLHVHASAPREYTEDEHDHSLGDPRLQFFDVDLDKTC
uniref:E3 ubiquitin-protein ligase Topors n=1 Tax=Anthurium amnicola TaxID=1678845 RepID=A0A1D1YUN3_9ARAE